MAKLQLRFEGFEEYLEMLNRLGEDIALATEQALQESGEIINNALHEEMRTHKVTGETEKAILEPKVSWNGTKASVKFGFDYKKGGETALYLERGRPHQKATPVIAPALEKSKDEIAQKQEESLKQVIARAGG